MKIYCVCGSPYLLNGYLYLMNKYWDSAEVEIIAWEPIECSVPVHVVSGSWGEGVKKFIDGCGDDRIILMLEDYWMVKPVDLSLLGECVLRDAEKVDLCDGVFRLNFFVRDDGWLELKQDSGYRLSLHTYIWKMDYLRRYMCACTPWEFEVKIGEQAKGDGGVIVGPNGCVCEYVNVMRRGGIDRRVLNDIPIEDRKYMRRWYSWL